MRNLAKSRRLAALLITDNTNWLASKEGLEVYARTYGHPTTRNDIDEASFLLPEEIPRPGLKYFDTGSWRFAVTEREKTRSFMEKLLKSR